MRRDEGRAGVGPCLFYWSDCPGQWSPSGKGWSEVLDMDEREPTGGRQQMGWGLVWIRRRPGRHQV